MDRRRPGVVAGQESDSHRGADPRRRPARQALRDSRLADRAIIRLGESFKSNKQNIGHLPAQRPSSVNKHQAGKKSIGLVTVIVPTSRASKRNDFTRATSLRSSSGSLSSLETTSQRCTEPSAPIVSSSTTLPCRSGLSRSARVYSAKIAPLLRSKTSAISSSLRAALLLPAPRCTLLAAWPSSTAELTCVVEWPLSEPAPPP